MERHEAVNQQFIKGETEVDATDKDSLTKFLTLLIEIDKKDKRKRDENKNI